MSSFVESLAYVVSKKIISVFSIISILILIIYHFIKIYLSPGLYKVNLFVKIIAYTILSTALIIGIYSALVIFLVTTPLNDSIITQSCYSQLFTAAVFYGINKTAIQYSYFLRLQISYKNSVFQINKCCLSTMYILSALYFVLIIMAYALSNDATFYYNSKYHICSNRTVDAASAGVIIGGTVIFYEFVVSIVALILFLRPMFRLGIYKNEEDKILIFKIGLLNSIMIVSSLISAICFMASRGVVFSLMDNVINSVCIVLMFRIHDGLFRKLCCATRCCNLESVVNERNIATELSSATSNSSV